MMEESIYNLIPKPEEIIERPPRYVSRHNPTGAVYNTTFGVKGTTQVIGAAVGLEHKTRGTGQHSSVGEARTFGTVRNVRPDPKSFTKKGSKMTMPEKSTKGFRYDDQNPRKAAVPGRGDRPVMGLQSTKNFITANAVEAILAVPGNRARQEIEPPVYRKKVDYGKVPAYLGQVKDEIQRENEMISEYVKAQTNNMQEDEQKEEQFDEEERVALVAALKNKWDSVNANYQKMCHMVKLDTIGKVRRKERMEAELEQLEKDIEKLNRSVLIRDY